MNLQEIANTIDGRIVADNGNGNVNFDMAFASDLMSDVLTLVNDNLVLITGLATLQTIRTAEMADINCIIFVRNKKVSKEMIRLANETGIDVIECRYSMFKTSGLLYQSGMKPVY
ncbi:MAG: DRTGG domain-containing protein [Bacteroidales bacterium]